MQALALTTLAKIVAAAGADRIRPHLPELVPALLEALSGLEVCSLPANLFPSYKPCPSPQALSCPQPCPWFSVSCTPTSAVLIGSCPVWMPNIMPALLEVLSGLQVCLVCTMETNETRCVGCLLCPFSLPAACALYAAVIRHLATCCLSSHWCF